MKSEGKRRVLFANKTHRAVFLIIFLSIVTPTLMVAAILYLLLVGMSPEQLAMISYIAQNVFPVVRALTAIFLMLVLASIAFIVLLAYKVTHRIVGPLERVERELDENLDGGRQGHIIVREKDTLWPLVGKINRLLDKAQL